MWDPDQYRRYGSERDRPFFDLLGQVCADQPRRVVDLGCGPGNLTATLVDRWPTARVTGVDSSAEMLARAQQHALPGRLDFVQADLSTWVPDVRPDVLVSNAALQWAPDHEALIPRLASLVAPGGWFAIQVPRNFDAPSHAILNDLRAEPHWAARLSGGRGPQDMADQMREDGVWYTERLAALGFTVNTWETSYLHLLGGDDPVLEWVKGTALRPVLAALTTDEQRDFLQEYGARLRTAYPARNFGTPFPFLRLFVVAQAPGGAP